MKAETRQKDIRNLIRWGHAGRLAEAKALIDSGERDYYDFEPIMSSYGIYGINGLCIEDKTTGDLYADAARTSLAFYFDRY